MRANARGRRLRWTALVLSGGMLLAGCGAVTTAGSTPTPAASEAPVRAVDLASGEQAEPVEVAVDGGADGVDVTFREITIEPGAGTGEHCHYGQLIAVVQEGELTHYAETHPGGVRVYSAGESIIEGAGYPHEGRNEGESDVVLWVTYVTPEGKPLAETDLSHCHE
ncbi:cupin domain-containing protein [Microbacterium caowuchunii]|uniref:cupin domain-containing protein n=1 Tax=Microbacterium caowuchunii TaxID=2614638 RepID=UPI00177C6E0D|nr:cupin domain-containing protein [Microbacterium caowuchunii]